VDQFLLFSISTAQKYFGQNFVTFGLPKTSQTFKPTQNELVLPPKPPTWFVMQFLSFPFCTAQKYSGQNFVTCGLPKTSKTFKPTQNELVLPPNYLWSSSYRSRLVWRKNISVKTLSLLVFPKLPKLPKLSNQPRMSWFCPQTPPSPPHMIFGAVLIILHQYGPKIFWSKLRQFWSLQNFPNFRNFQTNLEWICTTFQQVWIGEKRCQNIQKKKNSNWCSFGKKLDFKYLYFS